jgi:putative polyhydroxyalkanoate system protein
MAHIEIHRQHRLGHEQARRAAEEIAAHLDERFTLEYHWEGDSLRFKRSGINGHLDVSDSEVVIKVRLGMLMLALKPVLKKEVNRYMDEALGENRETL